MVQPDLSVELGVLQTEVLEALRGTDAGVPPIDGRRNAR
jgi:hypothetical protein